MKYLGIDFGIKRIGLAISEGELASPFKTIQVKGFQDALQKVRSAQEELKADKIVVGLPEGQMGRIVLRFVGRLKKGGIDVEISDETLSSKKAVKQMIEINIPQKKRRVSDDIAAAIILQDYLDLKNL